MLWYIIKYFLHVIVHPFTCCGKHNTIIRHKIEEQTRKPRDS